MNWLRHASRTLTALLMFAWWNIGLILIFASTTSRFDPGLLLYIIPLELAGGLLAWKAADPDRRDPL